MATEPYRYRIHFLATFYRDVEAEDDQQAREIAAFLADEPRPAAAWRCTWNTIERLE